MAYTDVASAPDAWAVRLTPTVPTTMTAVRAMLELAAPIAPLTAYAQGTAAQVYSVTLARDPSRTHGVPSVEDCERAVGEISAGGTWAVTPRVSGVMVAMGLREGYATDSRVWTLPDLLDLWPDTTGPEVTLVSARMVDGGMRWWEEPCVLLTPDAVDTGRLDEMADRMRQERYTITDHTNGRTAVRAVTP